MNLQESIRRILREEDYSPAGKKITPNSIIIHKSNPMFRDKIMEQGLKVRAGECYKVYVGYGVKCKPAIFATNSTNKRAWFDSTYDDDIWEINTEMIPDVKWYKDRHFESTKKHIVTFQDIPKEALTLKYEGTGSGDVKKWNKDSPNLYESIRKILREETEPILNDIGEKYYISWDENYGKSFKLVKTPYGAQSGGKWEPNLVSIVTPENTNAWYEWEELSDEKLNIWKENWNNIKKTLGNYKYNQIIINM